MWALDAVQQSCHSYGEHVPFHFPGDYFKFFSLQITPPCWIFAWPDPPIKSRISLNTVFCINLPRECLDYKRSPPQSSHYCWSVSSIFRWVCLLSINPSFLSLAFAPHPVFTLKCRIVQGLILKVLFFLHVKNLAEGLCGLILTKWHSYIPISSPDCDSELQTPQYNHLTLSSTVKPLQTPQCNHRHSVFCTSKHSGLLNITISALSSAPQLKHSRLLHVTIPTLSSAPNLKHSHHSCFFDKTLSTSWLLFVGLH